jgi:F-type H+-transporting ATPase subunit b
VNINATIIGQMITFVILVWFVMKYVWAPITTMMEARTKRIADGLAAGERGKHELELASKRSSDVLHEAKQKASEIITQAERRANQVIEDSKGQAKEEVNRILASAQSEIEQEANRAREALREQVASLAVAGAEQILRREVDAKAHSELLNQLKERL